MEGHSSTADATCTDAPRMRAAEDGQLVNHAGMSDNEPQLSAITPEDESIVPPWRNWREMKMQCSLAGPLIIGNVLSFGLQTISMMFVGHFGELELSGASIANSFTVVTGFSVVIGMGFALETFCGQAYGAKEYQKVGIYMHRAIVVLNVTAIPLAVLWANVESILIVLQQNAQIASKAGEYAMWLIPTLFGSATSQPFVKFLQAQSIVTPVLVISLSVLLCHILICWFMVFKSGMGFVGAALANSLSYWINALLLGLYVRFSKRCAQCRAPLSLKVLQDLKGFFQLAIPSAAMICLEWWSYEVLVILSGLLDNAELQTATISICVNTQCLIFAIPISLGAAASTRVSNALGAGQPRRAHATVHVAVVLAVCETLLVAITLVLCRKVWGSVYSSDTEVIEAIASLTPLVGLSTIFDGLQAVFAGVARGAGWQKAAAFINLGSFYITGLPIGCVLAFVLHLEGKGLWLGLIVGVFVQFVLFVIITHFTDWQNEARKAAMRVDAVSAVEEPLLRSED